VFEKTRIKFLTGDREFIEMENDGFAFLAPAPGPLTRARGRGSAPAGACTIPTQLSMIGIVSGDSFVMNPNLREVKPIAIYPWKTKR